MREMESKEKDRDHEKWVEGHEEVQSETTRNRRKPGDIIKAGGSGYTLVGAQTPWFFQNGWGPWA